MEKGNIERVCCIFSTISPVVKQLQTSGINQALPTCIITRAETQKLSYWKSLLSICFSTNNLVSPFLYLFKICTKVKAFI